MGRLIDISCTVTADWKPHGGPGYRPGRRVEFPVTLNPDMPDARGRTTREFRGGLHTGTHIDAPEHMHSGKAHVNDLPLETYMGEALVVDMQHKAPKGTIDAMDLEEAIGQKVKEGDMLLIRTEWSKNYGAENYHSDSPYLTAEAAEWCIQRGVRLVGADCHPTKHGDPASGFKLMVLGAGIPFLSNIDNLDQISKERVTLMAFPLNFIGVEASMVRAVVLEGDD
jgi:arylformamidase